MIAFFPSVPLPLDLTISLHLKCLHLPASAQAIHMYMTCMLAWHALSLQGETQLHATLIMHACFLKMSAHRCQ